MDIFDQLDEEPPEVLFHYTTTEGAYGILSTGEFWATKINYLNDRKELLHSVDLAQGILKSFQFDSIEHELIKQDLIPFLNTIEGTNICLVSFTKNGDLFSQWRGYSGNTTGCSIGFSSSDLKTFALKHGFFLRKCIYEDGKQKEILRNYFSNKIQSYSKYQGPTQISEITNGFMRLASLMKNPEFEQEEEWRLVSGPLNFTDERFRFRPSPATIIPYYALPIKSGEDYIRILHFIIGPNHIERLSTGAVRMLLWSKNYTEAQVRISSIPLRRL